MIGKFSLSIPAAPKQSLTIKVSFEVDNDGLLHVSAEETSQGSAQKITIKNESALTVEEK